MTTPVVAYFTQTDLENAIGKNTVAAIFDDDMDNRADPQAVDACIEAASVECHPYIRVFSSVTLPFNAMGDPTNPVPLEIKYAALDFGIAYAYRRKPDIAAAMGERKWTDYRDSAITRMKAYVDGLVTLDIGVVPEANDGEPTLYEGECGRYRGHSSRSSFENSDD